MGIPLPWTHPWYRHFLDDLRTLLGAGVPVAEALESLEVQGRGRRRELSRRLLERLRAGDTLSEAMAACPESVPEADVALIQAGERSGTLDKILGRMVEGIDHRRQAEEELYRRLAYPVGLTACAVVLLPLYLLLLGNTATYLLIQAAFLVPSLCALLLAWKWRAILPRGSSGRAVLERLLWKLPWIRGVILEHSLGKAMILLGTLLEAGIALSEAIPLAAATIGWDGLADQLRAVEPRVRSGDSLSEALLTVPAFAARPTWFARIAVGEKAGSLDRAFLQLGASVEERVRLQVFAAARVIPVVVFLAVAAVIAYRAVQAFSGLYGGRFR